MRDTSFKFTLYMDVWFLYVVFLSLAVFCDELCDCAEMLVCFPISICMFIVSKDLLLSSATVIVRLPIWMNPLVAVLSSVCIVPAL